MTESTSTAYDPSVQTSSPSSSPAPTFLNSALQRTGTLYASARNEVAKRSAPLFASAQDTWNTGLQRSGTIVNEGLKRSGTIYDGARENANVGLRRSGTIFGDARKAVMEKAGSIAQSLSPKLDGEEFGDGHSPTMLQRTGTLMQHTRETALKRTGTLLQDAQSYAKGLYDPNAPLNVSLREVVGADIPRIGHTISVIDGRAYIFGGSDPTNNELANNDMVLVILPSSGVHEADYKYITPRATAPAGPLPEPRKHHSAVVVGKRIYIFGGQLGDGKGKAEPEGRLWVFDTFSSCWGFVDPAADAASPPARFGHLAVSSEQPAPPLEAASTSYKSEEEILQDESADAGSQITSVDANGTIFIVGGSPAVYPGANPTEASDNVLADAWAFDIASASWIALPPPPKSMIVPGAALILSGHNLIHISTSAMSSPSSMTTQPAKAPSFDIKTSHILVSDLLKPRTHLKSPATQLQLPTLLTEWTENEICEKASMDMSTVKHLAVTEVISPAEYHYLLLVGDASNMLVLDVTLPSTGGFRLAGAEEPEDEIETSYRIVRRILKAQPRQVDAFGDVIAEPAAKSAKLQTLTGSATATGSQVEESHLVVWGGEEMRSGWMITLNL